MDVVSYMLGKNSSGGGGSSDLDWTAIGYEERPQVIDDGYNYALQIKNNWTPADTLQNKFKDDKNLMFMPLVDTSTTTNMKSTFQGCSGLLQVPLLDTSNVTNMNGIFNGCYVLKDIPLFNTSEITDLRTAFGGCYNLTDESLDNILQMCINVPAGYSRTKTLLSLSIDSTIYPASRIQALPNYQAFINAGWTIGY